MLLLDLYNSILFKTYNITICYPDVSMRERARALTSSKATAGLRHHSPREVTRSVVLAADKIKRWVKLCQQEAIIWIRGNKYGSRR